MSRSLCFFTFLIGAVNVGADAPSELANKTQTGRENGRTACSGYQAEVEVCLGGVKRHGRIIVTGDGCIHLEHLDEPARCWVSQVMRTKCTVATAWDERPLRAGPVRRVWRCCGQNGVLDEVHTSDASLKILRHHFPGAR